MSILEEVAVERKHQDEKWGGAKHDDDHTANDWRGYISSRIKQESLTSNTPPRHVLIEAAALMVAWVESYDRKGI